MKRKHLLVFLFLVANYNLSFSQISGYLSKIIKEPVEKKQLVLATYDLTTKQKDSINEKIKRTKLKNEKNKFKYAIVIIDPGNYFSKLGIDKNDLTYMSIVGQEKVNDIKDAEYVFKYTVKNVNMKYEGVKPTGSYSTTQGSSYYATGHFNYDVCFNLYSAKEKNNSCYGIDGGNNLKSISTSSFYSQREAQFEWKNKARNEGGNGLKKVIRKHFFQTTKKYKLTLPKKIINNKTFHTYLYLFKSKGSKKHLKRKSDNLAQEVSNIIDKHYSEAYSISLKNNKHKCGKVTTNIEAKNCFELSKQELKNDIKKLTEAQFFWKNEITKKYNRKGKKSTIRSVMAVNLLTTAYILGDNKNISFALAILKDESGKNGTYNNVKDQIPNFIKKSFYVAPNYYMADFKDENNIISGSDYKIQD